METILWLAGVLAMWTAIKFLFLVFKRLSSKNSMNDVIDRMEDGLGHAADKVAGAWKNRSRKERNRDEEESPMITLH